MGNQIKWKYFVHNIILINLNWKKVKLFTYKTFEQYNKMKLIELYKDDVFWIQR